jgi:RNase P/RNase MRP subunit POP5
MRGVMLSGVRLVFQIEPLRVRGVLQCMRERHLTVEAALAGSVQELN